MKTNKLFRLLLMLLAAMSLTGFAAAEDAATWADVVSLAGSASEITLTADVTVTQQLGLYNGKDVTIDLNGHTIDRGSGVGTMFYVSGGSKLTIKDSAAVTVKRNTAAVPARDNTPADGTGIGMPASFSGNTLTYYETISTKNGIYTQEQRYRVQVDVKGQVISDNDSTAAMILVDGGNSALRVEGGFFSNDTGRAVEIRNGGSADFVGGYFYGNTAGGNRGGAVLMENWNNTATLNFGGEAGKTVVFAGNRAATGGAVATNGNVKVTIQEGAVFSGNCATGDGRDGGGAIFLGYNTNGTMSGGLVTHNWGTANVVGSDDSSSYDACGGGILVQGTLQMSGGQVTSNEAAGGGGIATYFWDGGSFGMTDGIIAGNVARLNEGGGVLINMNGSGSIIGGYITNNATETLQHWGGGGIFIANDGAATMQAVLIADNEAGGFGGGLAGCSTGRIDAHAGVNMLDHSVAIYDNSAKGTRLSGDESTKSEDRIYAANDPVFMREGDHYQDYFCALNTTVCGGFLGGGTADWSGTVDGRAVEQGTIGKDERITSQYITGLTSHPTDPDIATAKAKATVFVTGNSSGTHGGGILCNGYLIIGVHRSMDIGDRMTIKGDKTLSGSEIQAGQFKFNVADENGVVIATGTNNAAGEIEFDGRIPFDKAGTYKFTIYEDKGSKMPKGITMDQSIYHMTVVVGSSQSNVQVATADDPTQKETIFVTFNKITSVTIEREVDGAKAEVASYTSISSEDRNAYELPFNFVFVNRMVKDTGLLVSKTVHDATNSSANASFDFTVTLSDTTINGQKGQMNFVNGVAKFTLKPGESRRAIELPVGTTFKVTETPTDGYWIENNDKIGTVVQDEVTTVIFENYAVGSLAISKTVRGGTPRDAERLFAFRITLSDTSINGAYGGVVFDKGVANVSLKQGQTVTIPNLPAGIRYEVEEMSTAGFTPDETSIAGRIAQGQTSKTNFVNTRNTGELHVKKHVVDSNYNGESFDFTVEMIGASFINGKYGDMNFVNGIATFSLKDGETARATGLPTGLSYYVTEARNENYAVSIVGDTNATIADSPKVVEFTNTSFSGLVISKTIAGTLIDRSLSFQFEITLTNDTETLADEYSGVKFVNGKATVTLKDGEYLLIDGLPGGTKYTVKELNVQGDRYLVWLNGVETDTYTAEGTLNSGDSARVDFTNLRKMGELEISKTLVSPYEKEYERVFTFNVTLSEPINGRFGDMVFTNGKATVYLTHGQTAKAINMPAGATYTVTEVEQDDFDSVLTGATGTFQSEVTAKVSAVNTSRLGDLRITKRVDGVSANPDAEFGFRIILDRKLSGTRGDVTFTDGVGEFTLKDGESVLITDLPEGTICTVIEAYYDALSFTPVAYRIEADIEKDIETQMLFVNKILGSLTVSKTITGDGADMTKKFAFTVTLDDKTITGTYGDMTFENGVATFELGHNEKKSAVKLPVGIGYVVTEAAEDYTVTKTGDTGTITAQKASVAAFVNDKTIKRGSLKVSKSITGDGADMAKKFDFTVTLDDTTINGTYGEMTFVAGVAKFKLGHNESATAEKLPEGVKYTVTEVADGYTATYTGDKGTISSDVMATASFINDLTIKRGSLKVSKSITGDGADLAKKFDFTVTLDDTTINGTYGEMTFVAGVAKFKLGHNESATAEHLPEGTEYIVTEVADGYIATRTGDKGRISAQLSCVASFINSRTMERGSLKVNKTITGDGADMTKKFDFTVTLDNKTINGKYGEMTFVNGVATFKLGHNESATAERLPVGTKYTVTEVADGYTVTKTGDTGAIAAQTAAVANFTNSKTLERGDLRVSKTVTGTGADVTRKFTFRVTLSDKSVNGVFGDMTFVNGVATIKLGHNDFATAKGLPAGLTYTVEELDYDDYIVEATNWTGIVNGRVTTYVTFINDRTEYDIPNTGDDVPVLLYGMMALLAGGLLVMLRRKVKHS